MQDKGRGYAQHAAKSMHAEFVKHESWKEDSREQESLEEYDRVRWTKESREDREVREVRVQELENVVMSKVKERRVQRIIRVTELDRGVKLKIKREEYR